MANKLAMGLRQARSQLAQCLDCPPREVVFTSGGTEANNLALQWLAWQPKPVHMLTSAIEHPAVLEVCSWLEMRGVEVDYLPVNQAGVVELETLPERIKPHTRLVSLMAVNNETGVIQPIEAMVEMVRGVAHGADIRIHVDAVQAVGRIPLPWRTWGVDLLSVSAHKLGGPKGVGALALGAERLPSPLAYGGTQERGLRPGTEPAPLIEGFAAAATWVFEQQGTLSQRWGQWGQQLIASLSPLPNFFWNGEHAPKVTNTLNFGFAGLSSETLLVALDLNGVAVSSGSACASGALKPSHVLAAMGLSHPRIQGALRFSMGWDTSERAVLHAGQNSSPRGAAFASITKQSSQATPPNIAAQAQGNSFINGHLLTDFTTVYFQFPILIPLGIWSPAFCNEAFLNLPPPTTDHVRPVGFCAPFALFFAVSCI